MDKIILIINLLQDVNIQRSLALLSARDLGKNTIFLVMPLFKKRDALGIWKKELEEISKQSGADIYYCRDEIDIFQQLAGHKGILIAASESNLNAHKPVHDVFRIAPASFLKVTLQHGFECVGFLQSRDQNLAHGHSITFGADVICGWSEEDKLTSVVSSQQSKLYVTGPSTRIFPQQLVENKKNSSGASLGLVCENMHSPRLNIAGDFKTDFLSLFNSFCSALESKKKKIVLRPHPGGQYTLKNKVQLPKNVVIENVPIYKVDLSKYAYGISAPSSILIDMILAKIPVAVWQDEDSIMDLGNYKGLERIGDLDEWVAFGEKALANPQYFLKKQEFFLRSQKILINSRNIYKNYLNLIKGSINHLSLKKKRTIVNVERIQFVTNGFTPTFQLSFVKPLKSLVATGEVKTDLITEIEMNRKFKLDVDSIHARNWLHQRFRSFQPTVVIFCRYAGYHTEWMLDFFSKKNIPTIYHLDDDLLNIPPDIGLKKHQFHNQPQRLSSIRYFLNSADLVYCSTERLKKHLMKSNKGTFFSGNIYCSGEIIVNAYHVPVKKIGYMGIGHEDDLLSVVPALVKFMKKYKHIELEFFGTIPKLDEFSEFSNRVKRMPKIENYADFLQEFAKYKWDIGICPLTSTPFNMLKANTKWVEYTSIGAAVIASKATVYDDCCANGCGLLVHTEDEWFNALETLTKHPKQRYEQVIRAQKKLTTKYSLDSLKMQVLNVIDHAKKSHKRPLNQYKKINTVVKNIRVLYVANGLVPTLQLSFLKPLAPLVRSSQVVESFITEDQLKKKTWKKQGFDSVYSWMQQQIISFDPTIVVFCRYSGPYSAWIMNCVEKNKKTPFIYHIDDDLLNIPKDIGYAKYKFHNEPERIESISYLLNNVSLIYCSTKKLKEHLSSLNVIPPIIAGKIYCSGLVISPAKERPVVKVGYMASADHLHNLMIILNALIAFLRRNTNVELEFFGSIPIPKEFNEFGNRIKTAPKVDDYEEFLQKFSERQWDIGICPLTPIHFNLMKANTKWVEYTAVGTAVVASKGTVYDDCCANGCGILAKTEDEWLTALETLTHDPKKRFQQVENAQKKLVESYSVERLREQVLDVFQQAKDIDS